MSNHLKVISFMASFFVLSGCASSPKTPQVNLQGYKYQLSKLNVNLKQKYDNRAFYTQSELEQKISGCINQKLQVSNRLGSGQNIVQIDAKVDYGRVYVGEAFGMKKSVSRPKISYSSSFSQNGQLIHKRERSGLTVSNGLLGNLKTVATMDIGNNTKQVEDGYLMAICNEIIKDIL